MKKPFKFYHTVMAILVFGILVFSNQAHAETEISGNITSNTIWTLTNSPYHITETVFVYSGAILTIEPGVIVRADAEKYLQIAGTLIARGSESSPIIFTSYNAGESWGGIKFIDSAVDAQLGNNYLYISGSIIEYADIEKSVWDCIRIEGTSPFISHSNIHNCANGIFIYNSNYSDASSTVIYSNIIKDIPIGYGVQQTNKVTDVSLVKIINNEISNTGTGIVSHNGQGPQIKDNILTNNKRGVELETSRNFIIENNLIDIPLSSQETSIGMNIVSNSTGTIQYNDLINNASTQPSNSALNIHNSDLVVQFNTITASSDTTIRVNCLGAINCSTIDSNNIYNTAISGYAIWNWGNVDINAPNNYWGIVSSLEIDNKIHDYYDDPSWGKVIYNPYFLSVIESAGSDKIASTPTCTSWTYSTWTACSFSGQQTRSIISSFPNNCVGGNPVLAQSCTYIPPPPPACTFWTYSDYGACVNGQQTRIITSSQPTNCIGGNPVLNQSCTVPQPNQGQQSSQPIQPTCSEDIWSCSDWGVCSLQGSQTRNCNKTFDCAAIQTSLPATSRFCETPSQTLLENPINNGSVLGQANSTTGINNGIFDKSLQNRLRGYILLQVESRGEAWYVNPADGKRYYMPDGATAYEMMRKFGLGITNADLAKLPQEKENKKYPSLYKNLKGKILLQVESHGEAWYINPKTGYRYYMQNGEATYSLMRFQSLGITNADLSKIPEGVL